MSLTAGCAAAAASGDRPTRASESVNATVVHGTRPAAARQVVGEYLRALAGHDAAAVCRVFSPQLLRFLRAWEPGSSCRARVQTAHFVTGGGGASVHRVDLLSTRVAEHDHGSVRVAVRIRYLVPCASDPGPPPGCHARVRTQADQVYLRAVAGRLLIVKPGEIYARTSNVAAPEGFEPFTPPVDRATLRQPAHVGRLSTGCPSGGRSVSAPPHQLTSQSGRRIRSLPISTAPWLGVRRVHASWVAADQLCVAINLAASPQPDSDYFVEVEQAKDGGGLSDGYDVSIDGLGDPTVALTDSSRSYRSGHSACPTSAGLVGTHRLVFIASPGDATYDLHRPLHLSVFTESLQPGEPLLAHPLDASDDVPRDPESLAVPAPAAGLRCRSVPAPR